MKLFILLLCMSLSPCLIAEEEPKHLRFMTLGSLPPYTNDRYLPLGLGNEKIDMLPRVTSLVSGDSLIPIKLDLKRFTDLVSMKTETEALLIRKGDSLKSQEWLRGAKPTAPLSLGVLYRESGKTWEHPKMLLLKDDAQSFPVGKIRFVNVSGKVVLIRLGRVKSKRFGISTGKSAIKSVVEGPNMAVIGYVAPDGSFKAIFKNEIKVRANERVQFFLYDEAPDEAKRKGGLVFDYVTETLPKLPAK